MATFEVIDPAELEESDSYQAPFCSSEGSVRSRVRAPEGFGQFVVYDDLEPCAEVTWAPEHGDEGVYVLEGEVEVDGTSVPRKGAVVLEAGAPARLRATAPSRLLHVGSTEPGPFLDSVIGPPDTANPSVHVFGPEGRGTERYGVIDLTFFTDSYCDGCRISFFRNLGHEAHVDASHSHTVHEMITVTEGELQVGPDRVPAVRTLAIPAGRRYGYRTKGPWEFVNFRSDASWYVGKPGTEPIRERVGVTDDPAAAAVR
jgi:quercetin dioxygenase-like cupin family protein